eukprot:2485359-Amphidinium_carterae.1
MFCLCSKQLLSVFFTGCQRFCHFFPETLFLFTRLPSPQWLKNAGVALVIWAAIDVPGKGADKIGIYIKCDIVTEGLYAQMVKKNSHTTFMFQVIKLIAALTRICSVNAPQSCLC